MKNRMKTHLKYLIAGLALLISLGLGNTAQATQTAISASQPTGTQSVALVQLAWQRVGTPLSLQG
jgi:hypothetical protein